MKTKRLVRQSLFFLVLFVSSLLCGAEPTRADILPDIEAHQSQIIPLEKSRTGRVYRFKFGSGELPKTGNIILVSHDQKPLMAFRVLKTVERSHEMIGKRVRRYDVLGELKINEKYTAVEKLADILAPPPSESGQYDPNSVPELDPHPLKATEPTDTPPLMGGTYDHPKPDLKTIESMDVEKFDDALDSSTSPKTLKQNKLSIDSSIDESIGESIGDEIPSQMVEPKGDTETEDKPVLQPFKNTISVQVGSLKNRSGFSTDSTSNSAFNLAYEHVLHRGLLLNRSSTQDSFSLEVGLAYYNRVDFTGNNDDYTLAPLRAEFHYNWHLNESFSVFAYLGAQYNLLFGSDNVNVGKFPIEQKALDTLVGPQANIGVGLFYNIGPQWYIRTDLGWDRIALGLAVKW